MGAISAPTLDSPALTFYGRAINLRAGDRIRFTAEGPNGFSATNESEAMPRSKAHYVGFAGRSARRSAGPRAFIRAL